MYLLCLMRYKTSRVRHVAFLRLAPRDDGLVRWGGGKRIGGAAANPSPFFIHAAPVIAIPMRSRYREKRSVVALQFAVYAGDVAICCCFAVRCFTQATWRSVLICMLL